jgi:hypothetical protein
MGNSKTQYLHLLRNSKMLGSSLIQFLSITMIHISILHNVVLLTFLVGNSEMFILFLLLVVKYINIFSLELFNIIFKSRKISIHFCL